MALSAKILTILTPGATGSVAYTGAGFAPQALVYLGTDLTADGSAANSPVNIGFGAQPTGTPTEFSSCSSFGDSTAGAGASAAQSKALFIQAISTSGSSLEAVASLTSLDGDGFTLNWTTAVTANIVCLVLCLGGADLTNSNVNEKAMPTSPGNSAITGMGFQPIVALFGGQVLVTTEPFALTPGNATQFLGAAVSTSNRFYTAGRQKTSVNPTVQRGAQKSTGCIVGLSDAGFLNGEADFVSFDADGLTTNFSTAPAAANLYGFLALKGIQAKIISFTSPGSTGNVAYTGAGFTPVVAIFSSDCGVSSASNTAHCRRMIGFGLSASSRAVVSWAGKDAVAGSSDASHNLDRALCVKHIVENHGSPTFPSTADLVSLDSDGFTLNWTAADATARETFVLLLGSAAGGAGWGALLSDQRNRMVLA